MKTIVIDKLPYRTPLGEGIFRAEVMIDDADLNEYCASQDINQLDYGLTGDGRKNPGSDGRGRR